MFERILQSILAEKFNKKPACFKNSDNPKVIDLLLANRSRSFCNSDTLETGLSDFHKLTLTVLKIYFKKQAPKMINYRNYKNFSNELFRADLIKELYLIVAFRRMTLLVSLIYVKSR